MVAVALVANDRGSPPDGSRAGASPTSRRAGWTGSTPAARRPAGGVPRPRETPFDWWGRDTLEWLPMTRPHDPQRRRFRAPGGRPGAPGRRLPADQPRGAAPGGLARVRDAGVPPRLPGGQPVDRLAPLAGSARERGGWLICRANARLARLPERSLDELLNRGPGRDDRKPREVPPNCWITGSWPVDEDVMVAGSDGALMAWTDERGRPLAPPRPSLYQHVFGPSVAAYSARTPTRPGDYHLVFFDRGLRPRVTLDYRVVADLAVGQPPPTLRAPERVPPSDHPRAGIGGPVRRPRPDAGEPVVPLPDGAGESRVPPDRQPGPPRPACAGSGSTAALWCCRSRRPGPVLSRARPTPGASRRSRRPAAGRPIAGDGPGRSLAAELEGPDDPGRADLRPGRASRGRPRVSRRGDRRRPPGRGDRPTAAAGRRGPLAVRPIYRGRPFRSRSPARSRSVRPRARPGGSAEVRTDRIGGEKPPPGREASVGEKTRCVPVQTSVEVGLRRSRLPSPALHSISESGPLGSRGTSRCCLQSTSRSRSSSTMAPMRAVSRFGSTMAVKVPSRPRSWAKTPLACLRRSRRPSAYRTGIGSPAAGRAASRRPPAAPASPPRNRPPPGSSPGGPVPAAAGPACHLQVSVIGHLDIDAEPPHVVVSPGSHGLAPLQVETRTVPGW